MDEDGEKKLERGLCEYVTYRMREYLTIFEYAYFEYNDAYEQ